MKIFCMRGLLVALMMTGTASAAWAQPVMNVGPAFGTWSVGDVQASLIASGGTGPYTWEVVAGTLPPGVSLRTDGPSWFNPNASAGLIGIATTPGLYTFTLRVTSGGQSVDKPDCTIRITALDVKDLWNLRDAFVGKAYAPYTLTALNAAGLVTWSAPQAPSVFGTFTGVPPGMSLNPSTGVLDGTPLTSGFYNIPLDVSDGTHTIHTNINISVFSVAIDTDGLLPNATLNTPYETTITASGGTGPYTFTSNGLPGGLTLNPTTGVVSGTPMFKQGPTGFNVTATDFNGASYFKPFALGFLGNPISLPSVNWFLQNDCSLGMPCNVAVSVFNGGRPPYTWTATGLPPGMDYRTGSGVASSFISPKDMELWGSPTALGDFEVDVTVTDADGRSASNTFPLHVAPFWQNDVDWNGGTIFQTYSHTLRIIGGTLPYSAEHLAGALPAGLTFNPATFNINTGAPQENGGFNARFKFTDSASPTPQTFTFQNFFFIGGGASTISINNNGNLGTVTIGGFSNQLSACCVPGYLWTHVGGALPSGLTFSSEGLLSGPLTTEGTYTFMLRAEDNTNPANFGQRQFTMIVTPLNNTTPPLPYGNVDAPYSQTLTVTGGTGPYTWKVADYNYLPPGLTLSTAGVLSGTPTAGCPGCSSGFHGFDVVVTDSAGHTHSRRMSFSIYAAGENPPLSFTMGPNLGQFTMGFVSVQLTATGGLPPYHYSLAPGATVVPGMRVQDGQPLPTFFGAGVTGGYLGVMTTSGTFETTLRVTDSANATFDMAVTFSVSPLNTLSQNNPPKATKNAPYFFAVTPFGGSGNYSLSLSNQPPGLAINALGEITGTPTAAGLFFQRVVLTDLSTGNSVNIFPTLTVDPFAIITGGVLPSGTVGTFYTQTLLAPDCTGACTWSTTGGLPFGFSLAADGVLSGPPTGTFVGSFTAQINHDQGPPITKRFALTIASPTPLPLVINTGAFTGPVSVPFAGTVADVTFGNTVGTRLSAQGGTPPYNWSLAAGSDPLPMGLSILGAGELASTNFDPGFSYLAGRAMQLGIFTFTLQVTDSAVPAATQAVTLTLRVSPIGFHYNGLPLAGTTLQYNTPYLPPNGQPMLAVGGTGTYTWSMPHPDLPLPAGLTLDPNTGFVSGTPQETGAVSVRMQASDGANSFAAGFNINIAGPTAVNLQFGSAPNLGVIAQGSALNRSMTPSGGTPPYTFTPVTPLPPGFALQSGDALLQNAQAGNLVIAATPLATGPLTFRLQMTDAAGNIAVRMFRISVASFSLLSSSLADATVGVPYSQALTLLNSTGLVNWSVAPGSALPYGLSVSAPGVISGTPTQAGNLNFNLNASDASGVVVPFTFTLRTSNISIPDAGILPQAMTGQPFAYTFTGCKPVGTCTTGAGSPFVWSAQGLGSGLSISPTTGTISGTPFGAASLQFTVTANDGVVSFSRRFTLFVKGINAPLINFALQSTVLPDVTVGQVSSVLLNPTGGSPPYGWTVAGDSPQPLPAGLFLISGSQIPGTFSPGTTVLTGTPMAAGAKTFDLIATDNVGATMRRRFTLNVSAIGILPGNPKMPTVGVFYAQKFTAAGGTPPYTFTMEPTSATQDMRPAEFSLTPDGLLSGTTTNTGTYSFLLKAADTAGNVFARSYTITINNASGLRVTNSNPADAWLGSGRRSMTLSTNSNAAFTWSAVTPLPPGLKLVTGAQLFGQFPPNTTQLAGQPTAPGTFQFTLRATEIATPANQADHTFTLRVSPMQQVSPPVGIVNHAIVTLPPGQVNTPYPPTQLKMAGGSPPYSFCATPTCPPGSPFTALPLGMTLSPTGILSGTPTQTGTFAVAPIVTDSGGNVVNTPGVSVVVLPPGMSSPLVPIGALRLGMPAAAIGVPYHQPLEVSLTRGGVGPFTFTLASGTLPPGLGLMLGNGVALPMNGVPTYLGGVPTTSGFFEFDLTVTDSSSPPQQITIPLSLGVSSLSLWPESLPNGVVGQAYPTKTFTASGGVSPYTIQVDATADLPPGLTLVNSVLSGTPTHAGNFLVSVRVIDFTGNSVNKIHKITIDNALGEAPALGLSPKPVQVFYQLGSPAPNVPIDVQTTGGGFPFALQLSNIPGATLSAPGGSAPATVNLNLNTGSLVAGTYFGLLGASAAQSTSQIDVTPVTLTVAPPPPCTYSVNPQEGSVFGGGGSSSFAVSSPSYCNWTATASDTWITITGGATGTGNGTVNYSVTEPSLVDRTGTISVNGAVFTLTQLGATCSFAISPVNVPATSAGGGPTPITVTASLSICDWTASSATLGISPANGTGNGTVNVTVPPNPAGTPVVHNATIGGQTLTVNQTGVNCTVSLSAFNASYSDAPNSGQVDITTPAGCPYNTVLGPSWIHVTANESGVGSQTIYYTIDQNSTTVSRSGTLTIGGLPYQINQDGLECSVTVNPAGLGGLPYGPAAAAGSIAVDALGPNCSWSASSDAAWATVSPASGTGDGGVSVSVTSNAGSTVARTAHVTIGGTSVNIVQNGTTCTYSLQSADGSVPASGGAGSVGVIAPAVCGWTTATNSPAWLTVSPPNGAGSSDAQFVAQANPTASERIGTLTIAGHSYIVTQAPAPCSYTLDSSSTTVSADGLASGSFGFSTGATGCTPVAVNYVGWIHDVITTFGGTNGTVTYIVDANPSAATRIGTIQVGDKSYTVTQTGGACGYSLNHYGAVFNKDGGNADFLGSPTAQGCTPTVGTTQQSIVTLGPLLGPVLNIFTQEYTVQPFGSLTIAIRLAHITFGGQIFTVKQTSW